MKTPWFIFLSLNQLEPQLESTLVDLSSVTEEVIRRFSILNEVENKIPNLTKKLSSIDPEEILKRKNLSLEERKIKLFNLKLFKEIMETKLTSTESEHPTDQTFINLAKAIYNFSERSPVLKEELMTFSLIYKDPESNEILSLFDIPPIGDMGLILYPAHSILYILVTDRSILDNEKPMELFKEKGYYPLKSDLEFIWAISDMDFPEENFKDII